MGYGRRLIMTAAFRPGEAPGDGAFVVVVVGGAGHMIENRNLPAGAIVKELATRGDLREPYPPSGGARHAGADLDVRDARS